MGRRVKCQAERGENLPPSLDNRAQVTLDLLLLRRPPFVSWRQCRVSPRLRLGFSVKETAAAPPPSNPSIVCCPPISSRDFAS